MFNSSGANNGLELRQRFNRNTIVSILSGVLFAIGWWIIIDATFQYRASSDFNKIYYIIGVVATLALILTNSVSNSQLRGDAFGDHCLGQFGARVVLFISFILAFGALIASAWVLFGYYIPHKKEKLYPGLAIFGQNLAILISTLMLKFGRKEDLSY